MVEVRYKGETYLCFDEKVLQEQLIQEGIKPNRIIEKAWDPETIRIVMEGLVWSVNGYILGKIFDRIPQLFRKKE